MRQVRLLPVMVLTILGVTSAIGVLLFSTHYSQEDSRTQEDDLWEALAFRSNFQRGLTPCDRRGRDIAERARANLLKLGEPHSRHVAVVAPTFSSPVIVSFDHGVMRRFRYSGQAGYVPYWDWFSSEPERLPDVQLSDQNFVHILAPLERHVTHAMTVSDTGHDGISYFLSMSGGECAFASPFRSDGPAALIGRLIYEASVDSPSASQLIDLATEINELDLSTEAPEGGDDDGSP